MSNDNCSVGMVAYDEATDLVLMGVMAFIPEGKIDEKNKLEKLKYEEFIEACKCVACGDRTVDYSVIEQYVLNLEDKLGCKIHSIGYDRYNAISSAGKWEDSGLVCVEIRQHSSLLHAPTKWLSELIENNKVRYDEDKLLEINFNNARCVYDTNLNRYVTKKKSTGKVDEVVSIINALYLLQQDVILQNTLDWAVQI
jgi:phage terminase large subunit-like protein